MSQTTKTTTTTTTTTLCSVCQGCGKRPASQRSIQLGTQPGKIIPLRGRQGTFVGVRAVEGYKLQVATGTAASAGGTADDESETDTAPGVTPATTMSSRLVQPGEILAALGCGDWRIYQLANGHKLTVDDFLCAWYTAQELRRRGYGVGKGMFGQVPLPPPPSPAATATPSSSDCDASNHNQNDDDYKTFHHADIGCGCGSVLMTMAWAFPNTIRSHGVEAQQVSFDLCRRGLQFNLGQDGSDPSHTVQLTHSDLREWDGGSLRPYHVITGTPPYFPKAHFVASQNHSQKIRCRVPTRGAAADYVTAAARLIRKPDGIICIAETARKEGEDAMWEAIHQNELAVLRRLDVITRTGLPPRFSCWLLTTKEGAHHKKKKNNIHNEDDDDETRLDLNLLGSSTSHKSGTRERSCRIETLTIRNEDQSRTLEYVEAMESMGWVDFEMTKEKKKMGLVERADRGL